MDYLKRAHRTLQEVPHASLASVTPDGNPWNTPLYIAVDTNFDVYWVSSLESVHSKNVANRPEAMLTIYRTDRPDESGAAVYAAVTVAALEDRARIVHGLQLIYRRRQRPVPPADDFAAPHPRRVYCGRPTAIWTNVVRDEGGYPADERIALPIDKNWDL